MFNVYVASEKISDQFHPDVITPYHPSFTTVPIKLILYGLLLSGMCQVNVQGGGGGVTFVSLIVNVRTSQNDLLRSIPTCAS